MYICIYYIMYSDFIWQLLTHNKLSIIIIYIAVYTLYDYF